jgi:hypothetical protein
MGAHTQWVAAQAAPGFPGTLLLLERTSLSTRHKAQQGAGAQRTAPATQEAGCRWEVGHCMGAASTICAGGETGGRRGTAAALLQPARLTRHLCCSCWGG